MVKEKATASEASTTNYTQLFGKIENLTGKDKFNFCKSLTSEEKKAYINHLKEKDTKMVSGVFKCFEPVGGSVTFNYRPYENIEQKVTMVDGGTYTIPLCVAKRLNNEWQGIGTWHPTHSHILDANGNPTVSVSKKNYRFAFMSSDFS